MIIDTLMSFAALINKCDLFIYKYFVTFSEFIHNNRVMTKYVYGKATTFLLPKYLFIKTALELGAVILQKAFAVRLLLSA